MAHVPLAQVPVPFLIEHGMLQAPQFVVVLRGVSQPLFELPVQWAKPERHAEAGTTQAPVWQETSAAFTLASFVQSFPQPPQFCRSDRTSRHPAGQVNACLIRTSTRHRRIAPTAIKRDRTLLTDSRCRPRAEQANRAARTMIPRRALDGRFVETVQAGGRQRGDKKKQIAAHG
jgi:hypothetical protein